MKKLPLVLVLTALLAALWYWGPSYLKSKESAAASSPSLSASAGGSGKAGGDGPPVPVVAGEVQRKDVPIFLSGIGNVQAYQTVAVRPRVDGQLEKILFQEGQDVKAGELLAQIDARPFQAILDQALAKRVQDAALLENARLDLKRDLTLLSEKAGTAQKADTQRSTVAQLEATLKADDAAIEAARIQLDYTNLRTPIDGTVGIRGVDVGNMIRASEATSLVVVTQLKPISVMFSLPEGQLLSIQSQMGGGSLPVYALGRDGTTPIAEGSLAAIDNQIDQATGTIRLKATFPNEDRRLWPGQFVNVRLKIETKVGAAVVPASAVQRGPSGPFAFVIQPDNTVEVRPIRLGVSEDGLFVIESGLSPGERIVIDGQYRLQKGSKIRTAEGKGQAPNPSSGVPSKNRP